MLALDLFNTRYERQLQEGGVDNLEARRIDDLNMKMLELLDRAKEPAYKKNPAALAGLKKQFQKIKSERDSYFKINPATGMNDTGTLGTVKGALDELGIPGNVPTEKIPGKEDLLKGKGRSYYEGAEDYAGIYSPEAIALGKRFCDHYNITDDGDVQLAVEIIDSYLDEYKATGEPVDLKRIKSGVADAFRQVYRGMGPGPNFRKRFQEETQSTTEQSPRALGVANFQRLVKANMGNIPTVSLEFIRPEENFKLDQKGLDLISDYYDGLENDQAKNYFIYRVLPSGEETLKVLKQLGYSPAHPVQQELPGVPTQGELPLSEKQSQKKNDPDNVKSGDAKTARQIQKIRAQYPAARTDIEALAQSELDSTERSQQQLAAIRGANEKQDTLLKQLVALDQEQGREISGLDKENNSLEQRLAQVQATNDQLTSAINQITGTKKAPARQSARKTTDAEKGGIIDLAPGAVPIAVPSVQPRPAPKKQKATAGKLSSIPFMAQQIKGANKSAPSIRPAPSIRSEPETIAANDGEPYQQLKVAGSDISEHGGGIGPKQHWQDLMPEQSNSEDDDWYDDEDEDDRLRSGDYVRDTMDGESGEIFRMQGDPYERRVRILDRDGKGWYIEPGRLTRVDPQDPDIQRYFGKKKQSMDEFDASGYDRYSIYMDDYDLKEKFSDLDDAVDAIEAYKRDDPKSRYADYNVRDLDGKIVWRNDAWQDVQKPGKIQFLSPKTEARDGLANTNTEQQWMQSMKQQYPGVKFAQNKTTMQIFAMVPGKGKVGTFDPRQQVKEFTQADVLDPVSQTDTPPRRAYSIVLDGRPGQKYRAEQAWKALTSVFPKDYPGEAAEHKISEVAKKGSAIVKTGIASEDLAQTYVSKLSKFVSANNWRIVGGSLDEATGDSRFDSMMGRISNDPWTRLNADPNWEYEIEELVDRHIEPWLLAMEKSGMPITRDKETLNPGWRKRYEQVANQLAQKYLTSKGLNPRDPDLVGKIRYAIDSHTDQSRNVAGQLSAYSELPLQRYQNDFDADGMTANMRDAMVGFIRTDDDDDDEPPTRPMPDNDPRRLDPGNMEEAVDEKGATDQVKKVFKDKSGKPVGEIGVDPESSPGNGEWYVHHYATGYSVVGFDSAAEAKRELMYVNKHPDAVEGHPSTTEQGVEEGWSDAMVARRTGGARTPYSVYIKGKKWKDFENDDHAEAVANKLKAKFAADGRDPETITIAPTDYDQPIKEEQDTSGVERAILNRIMVAHTDLLMRFGPDKVMQAAEEVAYNVGDVDEIGTSDVSAYVAQVKQILGATP